MTSRRVDVAVIGLGSAGEAVADELAASGREVVGFEPGLVGGECPFTACMPSKALLHDAMNDVPWSEARAHRDEVVAHHDDAGHVRDLEDTGVVVVRAPAEIVEARVLLADGRRWRADHVILATGSSPVIPPVGGIDEVPHMTSDELMVADELPESLMILGGGPIGCEAASIMAGFGRPVTVVENDSLLGGTIDPAVADRVARQLRGRGVDVRTQRELAEVEHHEGGIRGRLDSGDVVSAAALLVATGQAPNWSELGLGSVGIDGDPEVDDEYRVDGHEWLRAIGDLNGRAPWTHGANHEARRLARLLVGRPPGPAQEQMAHCVFTDPPVAAIGLTAAQAAEQGIDVVVGTARYSDVARYATDDLEDGLVVVVADAGTGEILGCSGTGARFDDVIGVVAALRHCRATVQQASELVLPFPTIAQVLTPAFRDAVDALA